MKGGITIEGDKELDRLFGVVAPRVMRSVNRQAVHALAGMIRDEAKENAARDEGTLKKAIKAKRRRPKNPDRPFSDVIVEHGKGVRNDAFYWHFQEYGTVNMPEQPFMRPAIRNVKPRVPALYKRQVFEKLRARLERDAKRKRGK